MSSLLYGKAKRVQVGDRSAKLMLLILCDYADENNCAWPSIDRLMAEGEASASTVQRALRYLEDRGLIVRDTEYGTRYRADHSPYVYRIVLDKAEPVEYRNRKSRKRYPEPRGVMDATPCEDPRGSVDDTPSDSRGSTHDTPSQGHGVSPMTSRGVTGDRHGVSPMTPRGVTHDTQSLKEPSLEPSERVRAREHQARRIQLLADFRPDDEQRSLADDYGMDCDWELRKFRAKLTGTGEYPADPKTAFTLWLDRGHELSIGKPPASAEDDLTRRARKLLTTSSMLKTLQPDTGERLQWLPQVVRLLAEGVEAPRIVVLIRRAMESGSLGEAA
ncbi:helix-turn-helix domain-containing protein [Bifidobacterium scardovii]|uniref:Cryptic prophage protein n=1 Tax=Bifidobacterium scardovii TaxID=158787 RepID=A0A087DI56_9BIFI|nr:helix-turn-helix domain-containing protein [Bifidobacterium scardovii]KFI95206.1 cryptic prophage protein [Bifidobacterium scardovii]MDK6348713.1 helix-turn-helix domain-containing protein [Bifidobacterium scardovii]MDU8981309.1 helix-turn-helix domain-containing protein [Bifidobacterium scardovii]BAQ31591.1 hypothetical protein BBSC_1511 [Bifidobacterium scardovii JCM 12489 = DSM 13734]